MSMRGYCGIGIFHGKKSQNIGTLFRSAHAFGAHFIFTVGRRYDKQPTDTTKAWRHVPLAHYPDLDALCASLPMGAQIVGVEMGVGGIPLERFVHPERAVYLLGAEDHGLLDAARERCRVIVEIPGSRYCLNVATAGSIVLWHRLVTHGGRALPNVQRWAHEPTPAAMGTGAGQA